MQAAQLDAWVAEWQARASRAGVLTSDEWSRVKTAICDSYVLAGLEPPMAVIRARSPREAMASALAHQSRPSAAPVSRSDRITEAIRAHEESLLGIVRFSGTIAARVDSMGVNPNVWGTELHPAMLRSPGSGNWRPGVAAELSWLVDHGRKRFTAGVLRGLRATIGRGMAGPVRFLADLAFVSDRPTHFRRDDEGRPHSDVGAAIEWADGTGLNFWHGTRVPDTFFRWSPQRALAEVNVEVRRCALERLGVDVLERHLTVLAEAPDPANPPHVLRLYDLPRPWLSGRLLVVENASLDKGGHRRRFHLFVPPHITDPVEAAANSFGMTAEEYRRLERAT